MPAPVVTNCNITRDGVRITETKRWAQSYSATFQILTDAPMGALAVQIAARSIGPVPVPVKGSAYSINGESDNGSYALDFVWTQDKQQKCRWFCDVTWRPPDPRDNPDNYDEDNPTERTAIQWFEFEETTEVVTDAKNITALAHLTPTRPAGTLGKVVNTAGQIFDSLPERPDAKPVLVLQRNYPTLAHVLKLFNQYYKQLNSDAYLGAAPKTLFVRKIVCGAPQYENGYTYYQGQIHIAYNPATWKFSLVNQGMAYLAAGKLVNHGSNGAIFTEPILLTSTGAQVTPGNAGNTIEYEYADTTSFLNIGNIPELP